MTIVLNNELGKNKSVQVHGLFTNALNLGRNSALN